MFYRLQSYKQIILKYKKINKNFQLIKQFLDNGIYSYDEDTKTFFSSRSKSEFLLEKDYTFFGAIVSKIKSKKTRLTGGGYLFNSFINLHLHRHSFNPDFRGKIAIISSVDSSIKVFDYINKLVLTFYRDCSLKAKVDSAKKYFYLAGFNIVDTIITYSYREKQKQVLINHCLVERMVKKESFDHIKGFEYLIDRTTRYHAFAKNSLKLEIDSKKFFLFLKVNNIHIELSESSLTYSIPKKLCHGDAHPLNLIFSEGIFYCIDFEMVNYHSFFFDIMFYMFFEGYRFNNSSLLLAYKKGCYDGDMKKLFKTNNFIFNPSCRLFYFLLMIYEYYYLSLHSEVLDIKIVKLIIDVFCN